MDNYSPNVIELTECTVLFGTGYDKISRSGFKTTTLDSLCVSLLSSFDKSTKSLQTGTSFVQGKRHCSLSLTLTSCGTLTHGDAVTSKLSVHI